MKKDIATLIAENYEKNNFYMIKEHIRTRLKLEKLDSTNDPNSGYLCLAAYIDQNAEQFKNLPELLSKMPELLYQLDDKKLIILAIDDSKISPDLQGLSESFSKMVVNDKSNEASSVTLSSSTPFQSSLNPNMNSANAHKDVTHQSKPAVKQTFWDSETLAQIYKLQNTANLDSLSYPNSLKNFKKTILHHPAKNMHYLKLFILEYACRGELTNLQTLFNLECKGNVVKTTTKMQPNFFKMEIKDTETTVKHSYILKANFDPKEFISYFKLRRENTQHREEGSLEQISACLEHTSGSTMAKTILTALQKVYVIPTLENTFDSMLCS